MSSERIDPEFRDAVVTYSRVPARGPDFGPDASDERMPATRREPTLDATEIHVLDDRELDRGDFDRRDPRFGEPRGFDRAGHDRDDGELDFSPSLERPADDSVVAAAALDLDGKRSPLGRILITTAALSIVAGVGVLAATVGIATLTPERSAEGPVVGAPAQVAAIDPQADSGAASGIREIPIATGADSTSAVAPPPVAPPVPRARPDDAGITTASTTPAAGSDTAKTAPIPAAEPLKPTVATLPPPPSATPVTATVPVLPPPTARTASAPAAGGNTDDLISNIEQTLAKRDGQQLGAPPAPLGVLPGSLDPHGMVVLPDDAGPVAVLPPPPSMAPGYPSPQPYPGASAQGAYPGAGSQGPTYDILPPEPVTGNGYGRTYPSDPYPSAYPAEATPSGPLPPADVPYGYPSRPMTYEVVPEKKPGILKRTWTRTADAVTSIFSRDRDGEKQAQAYEPPYQ